MGSSDGAAFVSLGFNLFSELLSKLDRNYRYGNSDGLTCCLAEEEARAYALSASRTSFPYSRVHPGKGNL
jgi:hypothetical protein